MARYPTIPERVTLAGANLEELQAARHARRRICASRKYEYAWLRIDPCIELPEEDARVPALTTSQKANEFIHGAVPFAGRGVEYFAVLCLNTKNQPLAVAVPFKGGRASITVDVAVILQSVLLTGSSSFIVVHNHPSQDSAPSSEDIALIKRLEDASKIVQLQLLDSLIVTDRENVYSSFRDMGLMRG